MSCRLWLLPLKILELLSHRCLLQHYLRQTTSLNQYYALSVGKLLWMTTRVVYHPIASHVSRLMLLRAVKQQREAVTLKSLHPDGWSSTEKVSKSGLPGLRLGLFVRVDMPGYMCFFRAPSFRNVFMFVFPVQPVLSFFLTDVLGTHWFSRARPEKEAERVLAKMEGDDEWQTARRVEAHGAATMLPKCWWWPACTGQRPASVQCWWEAPHCSKLHHRYCARVCWHLEGPCHVHGTLWEKIQNVRGFGKANFEQGIQVLQQPRAWPAAFQLENRPPQTLWSLQDHGGDRPCARGGSASVSFRQGSCHKSCCHVTSPVVTSHVSKTPY